MTPDELTEIADSCWEDKNGLNTFNHLKFAAIVAANEREACAKVCEKAAIQMNYSEAPYKQCAAAIRARGEK